MFRPTQILKVTVELDDGREFVIPHSQLQSVSEAWAVQSGARSAVVLTNYEQACKVADEVNAAQKDSLATVVKIQISPLAEFLYSALVPYWSIATTKE